MCPLNPEFLSIKLTNTELEGRYRIEKEIFSDPYRNVVLQKIRFVPLQGKLADYRLYALLAPHLANCGSENTGWVGDYKGTPMLFAQREDCALAFACSTRWKKMAVGFAGFSDGWQDLSQHYQMTWDYTRAENGNVALTGEIDLAACGGEFTLALGFGEVWTEAGLHTRASLLELLRRIAFALCVALEELAGQPAEARRASSRSRPLSHQHGRDAFPRIEGFRGRSHRQPFDSVGLQQRR